MNEHQRERESDDSFSSSSLSLSLFLYPFSPAYLYIPNGCASYTHGVREAKHVRDREELIHHLAL